MRNPLSAILQCADEISTSLAELTSNPNMDLVLSAIIKESISSVETIRFVLSTKSLSLITFHNLQAQFEPLVDHPSTSAVRGNCAANSANVHG
ncbi:uncharacterized protein K444DRAFT_354786 [Hyaloscypha bicolor E]|uniref:Uncharacterized protein n=1 Tax=Hyaloscypha bicolor E TaxID=1095630 RepID=A0A2J6TIU9_9HELO|nr:uncharacterized protein K444DRAFT_354786 [Hyaloscypha bicolor E]PMD62947.1 hypothetical protein K444DRAFT_354786 [Hyaloscypha bicolor E]